jgi:hypothetical protein
MIKNIPLEIFNALHEIEKKYSFFKSQYEKAKDPDQPLDEFEYRKRFLPQIHEEYKKTIDIYHKIAPNNDKVRALAVASLRYSKGIEKYSKDLVAFYQEDHEECQVNDLVLEKDNETLKNLETTIVESADIIEKIAFRAKVGRLMAKYKELLNSPL